MFRKFCRLLKETDGFLENLPYIKEAIFSKNSKSLKNSMILLNNNKRNINNKSMINRSLMQNKQEHSSSFSEGSSSSFAAEDEENFASSSKKNANNGENTEEFQNTNFLETKTTNCEMDFAMKFKNNTPKNPETNIKKLFMNSLVANNKNSDPSKKYEIKNIITSEQNISFLNSFATNSQINQKTLEETHPFMNNSNNINNIDNNNADNNNSPKTFNKTIEKFKSFLNNDQNKKKIAEKFQSNKVIENAQITKKNEKKNLSALFGNIDEKTNFHDFEIKISNEALIKKNHELQIENYNLRKEMNADKTAFSFKMKKLFSVSKKYIDKNIEIKAKFELGDLEFIIEKIEKHLSQGILSDVKEKILTQFDNLRDYYRVILI